MPYAIDPIVDRQNHTRCHAPENHYVKELESRGALIRIDNVAIDAEQLIERRFVCDPTWCLRSAGEGSARHFKGSCCTDLQVDITAQEKRIVEELGAEAAKKGVGKDSDAVGCVLRRIRDDRFTDRSEKEDLIFRHLPNGRCALSWMTRQGQYRCSINTMCMELGKPLEGIKPDPCFLFPLHYVEYQAGQLLLTAMCDETHVWIGADKYVGRLRCLRKPKASWPRAYESLKYEIIYCLGAEFYAKLEAEAAAWLQSRS